MSQAGAGEWSSKAVSERFADCLRSGIHNSVLELRYGPEAGCRFLHPTHFFAQHRHVWYTEALGSVEFIHFAPLVFRQARRGVCRRPVVVCGVRRAACVRVCALARACARACVRAFARARARVCVCPCVCESSACLHVHVPRARVASHGRVPRLGSGVQLRKIFHCSDDDYLEAFCALRDKGKSAGKSGQRFYISANDTFIIKTISSQELGMLRKMLSEYHAYMAENPHSLLPQFFGLYSISLDDEEAQPVVVMANVFKTDLEIHETYDLKGSTINRFTKQSEGGAPLKDLNLEALQKRYARPRGRRAALTRGMRTCSTDAAASLQAEPGAATPDRLHAPAAAGLPTSRALPPHGLLAPRWHPPHVCRHRTR